MNYFHEFSKVTFAFNGSLGRAGVINDFSFPRLNPQGYAKTTLGNNHGNNIDNKPAVSTSAFQTNVTGVYRPLDQLKEFEVQDEQLDEETFMMSAYEDPQHHEDRKTFADALEEKKMKPTPSVLNPFEFPSLPAKQSLRVDPSIYEVPSDESRDEQQEVIDYVKALELAPSPVVENVKPRAKTTPPKRVLGMPSHLDCPIFHVYRYPPLVTDSSDCIPKPKLHQFNKKVIFEVNLTVVHSPWQFYFQYHDRSFDLLCNRMDLFYSHLPEGDLIISKLNMKKNLVVAARIKDSWHRAIVLDESSSNEEFNLFFADIGNQLSVHIKDVRYLLKSLLTQPARALRGSLAQVREKNSHISKNKNQTFFNVVSNMKLFASIRKYDKENDVHSVDLSQHASELCDDIGKLLITLGCAQIDGELKYDSYAIPYTYLPKTYLPLV